MANTLNWLNASTVEGKFSKCGWCHVNSASHKAYYADPPRASILICAHCTMPTVFIYQGYQTLPTIIGGQVENISSPDIALLYQQARERASFYAYTGAAMICRKILMNLSVSFGAEENGAFTYYVDYLDEKGHIPPGGKEWVDSIRQLGGEATHEIHMMDKDQAELAIAFTEGLLRFNYELPSKFKKHSKKNTGKS